MPQPQDSGPRQTIKVTCAVCHELIETTVRSESYRIACPFCEREIVVPSSLQVQAISPQIPHRTPAEIGDYGVNLPAVPPAPVRRDISAVSVVRETIPGFSTSIKCAVCGQSFGTRLENRPKRVSCPHCGEFNQVAAQAAETGRPKVKPDPLSTAGDRAAQPPDSLGQRKGSLRRPAANPAANQEPAAQPDAHPEDAADDKPQPRVLDQLGVVRQEVVPLPPKSTFFSNVLEFPWRRATVARWGYLSFGWTLWLMILAAMMSVASQFGGSMFGLVVAFFALPLIWVGVLSSSYAAANFLCVVELTAAGQDEIVDWPEPNWREWMPQLIYLVWIGAIPAVVSYGVGDVTPGTEAQRGWVSAIVLAVLYPICLMSALEANSAFVPLTGAILKSLIGHPVSWLVFFILGGVVWSVVLAVGLLGWHVNAYVGAALLGPAAAAAVFILARLFGRLAWKISGIEKKWAKARRHGALN